MITYAVLSKDGGREINEDSVGYTKLGRRFLFALADGLGGHGGGDHASKCAVEKSLSALDEQPCSSVLSRCFLEAQSFVLDEQIRLNMQKEMKTTLACLLAEDEKKAVWGHIGDSRVYYFSKSKLITRSLDHSVPQMLVSTGEIKESQIREHEDRNRLLRVIGVEWPSPRYELSREIDLKSGDSFLLCSDGFWELIHEKLMQKHLKASPTPDKWLESMEREVLKNGKNKSMDNYSAIAVYIR